MTSKTGLVTMLLIVAFSSGCSRGGGNANLGAASGNTLNEEQIDAALGPANQAERSANAASASNAEANAAANE